VTAPTVRIHPAVIAQAAATSAAMMPGRFFLGVGSGENLNEHILGDRWPPTSVRLEMLEEAIEVISLLWEGGNKSHHGKHYIVENARIYDLPDERPPIAIAAAGPKAARLAGRMGDALVSTAPDEEVITTFDEAGGAGKPRYAEVQVCWAADEDEALDIATEWWPNVDVPGELGQELPVPRHFEQAAENADRGRIADKVSCGPDPEKHLDGIRKFVDAGFDHICVHQIGPDQEGFFEFYERQVLPKLG
jgi:coenzyme F420-dependent glucose-6-phosphate dehydrogenase